MSNLYHASTEKMLTIIEPQRTLSKNKYIGEFVFATMNKTYAAMYLTPKGRPSVLSVFGGKSYLVLNDTPEHFSLDDRGGAIYEVPVYPFEPTPQFELADTEMVSRQAVKPLRKEVYATSLEALNALNVPVFFVDETIFNAIQNAEDHGWSIIESLQPYNG